MKKSVIIIFFGIILIVFLSLFILKIKNIDLSAAVINSETITYNGTIMVFHGDDFKNKKSIMEYYLSTPEGKNLKINFTSPPSEKIIDGIQVSFSGVKSDTQIDVDPQKLNIFSVNEYQRVISGDVSIPSQKKLAVILFNFQNDTTQEYPKSFAKQRIFLDPSSDPQSVNGYFKEISFNKFKFIGALDKNGDVFGWYTLPVDNTPCSPSSWGTLANQLALIDGFVKSNYDTVMYVFPQTTNCLWGGMFSSFTRGAYLNGGWNPEAMRHELGHSLGLAHANSLICQDSASNSVVISKNCIPDEYGDVFDTMGNAWRHRHPNSLFKSILDFMPLSQVKKVQSSGLYTLYPSNLLMAPGYRSIEIPIMSGIYGEYSYVLEYRKPYGVFDNFLSTDPVVNGVSVRIVRYKTPLYYSKDIPYLIDANPQTSSFEDAPFLPGTTFNDPDRGITISVLPLVGTNPSFIRVQISITQQPWLCVKNIPLITLTPSSQSVLPGTSLTYYLSITNNDNSFCSPTIYKILDPYSNYSGSNSGFVFNLPNNSLTNDVIPGTTQVYPIGVSRPLHNSSFGVGTYQFNLNIKDAFRIVPSGNLVTSMFTVIKPTSTNIINNK